METATRYPGSRPFQDIELDRLVFFGREGEKHTLFHTILAEDLVLVYAKSGVGKTSLLNAGILEDLRQADYFPVPLRLQGGSLTKLQDQVREQARQDAIEIQENETSCDDLWHFFREVEFWKGDTLLTPVLIFDQFEELFSVCSNEERRKFIEAFFYLTHRRLPQRFLKCGDAVDIAHEKTPLFKLVIAMREDFLGELELVAAKVPHVMHNRFRLERLTRQQAEQAIRGPAEANDRRLRSKAFNYEKETVDQMLDFLCRQRDRLQE